jgi:hypothetical protein
MGNQTGLNGLRPKDFYNDPTMTMIMTYDTIEYDV